MWPNVIARIIYGLSRGRPGSLQVAIASAFQVKKVTESISGGGNQYLLLWFRPFLLKMCNPLHWNCLIVLNNYEKSDFLNRPRSNTFSTEFSFTKLLMIWTKLCENHRLQFTVSRSCIWMVLWIWNPGKNFPVLMITEKLRSIFHVGPEVRVCLFSNTLSRIWINSLMEVAIIIKVQKTWN